MNHECQSCLICKSLPRPLQLGLAMQLKVWRLTSALCTQRKALAYLTNLRKGSGKPAQPTVVLRPVATVSVNPSVSLAESSFVNRDLSCSINDSMAAFLQEEVTATSSPNRPSFPLHHGMASSQEGETEVLSTSFAAPISTPVQRMAERMRLPPQQQGEDSQEASDTVAEESPS